MGLPADMAPNKVPAPRSQAGPGCWQCADCGLIVSDDSDECGRCTQQETLVEEGGATEEVGLDAF